MAFSNYAAQAAGWQVEKETSNAGADYVVLRNPNATENTIALYLAQLRAAVLTDGWKISTWSNSQPGWIAQLERQI